MTEPLDARVDAPDRLALPEGPEEVHWRPATMDDVDAILDCEKEIGAADHPHYVTPREEIVDDFEHSFVDLAADTALAVAPDGTVLAWGLVMLPPVHETLVRSILFGGVRPAARGRGIGRRLLAWQEGRGMQQLASSRKQLPGWLMAYAQERSPATTQLLERAGFSLSRYFLELTRDFASPVPDVPLPAGLQIEQFSSELSHAVHLAKDDAFRDHWGSQPGNDEQWESYASREMNRDDLSSIALTADGGVAGLVLVSVNEEDWPGQGYSSGYIDLVGVPRAWRRRGIAPALLANTLRLIAAAGLERAVLDVDAENPTGALGLYTGLGFTEATRTIAYTKVF